MLHTFCANQFLILYNKKIKLCIGIFRIILFRSSVPEKMWSFIIMKEILNSFLDLLIDNARIIPNSITPALLQNKTECSDDLVINSAFL